MNYTQKVKEHLARCDLSTVSLDSTASAIFASSRTLSRRLSDEGFSFIALREEARKRRCVELLKSDPRANAEAVARDCGYSEATTAARAFRGWFGCGLREFRNDRLER